jgi:hypothetical protein
MRGELTYSSIVQIAAETYLMTEDEDNSAGLGQGGWAGW